MNNRPQKKEIRLESRWTAIQARLGWALDFLAIGGVVAVIAVAATVLS